MRSSTKPCARSAVVPSRWMRSSSTLRNALYCSPISLTLSSLRITCFSKWLAKASRLRSDTRDLGSMVSSILLILSEVSLAISTLPVMRCMMRFIEPALVFASKSAAEKSKRAQATILNELFGKITLRCIIDPLKILRRLLRSLPIFE